ncbi:MAG: isoprenyl transferase [Deltaproteobacteria bacterium]|nr:isoprenyl transferase [Deltaproteobacteria bacterium]
MTQTNNKRLPEHVAIIMDGNGRWAKKNAMNRIRGHEEGTKSVREIVRATRKLGIPWLSLYAFSEENWKRPKLEINALMKILKRFLKSELIEMQENGIRFNAIGRLYKLPEDVRSLLIKTIKETSNNRNMVLTLAISYGSRQEITDCFREISKKIKTGEIDPEKINEQLISDYLYTSDIPDPDLLIRTSGEFRVSNFMLWQLAYTEMYITPTLWPDFRKEEYLSAIGEYQNRERRFGAIND